MTRTAELIVIGGGIAGLSVALAAADRGMRVIVLDLPRPGAASRAAAGMLAPSLEGLPPGVLPAALAARDYYPGWLAMLEERGGLAVALNREGILELAASDQELETMLARATSAAEPLGAGTLARLEPGLSPGAGALLHPTDGAVDNVALMSALAAVVRDARRIRLVPAEVASVELRGDGAAATTGAGERFAADAMVLATGAWAGVLPGLPRPLPVQPVGGQLLMLAGAPLRHVVYGGGGYLVPRGGNTVIGATTEPPGFAVRATAEGRESLLEVVRRAAPAMGSCAVVDHWAGLRPSTPDGLPILGADPEQGVLHYACGFARNGILLAPWAAELIVAALAGTGDGTGLAPFRAGRFGVQP